MSTRSAIQISSTTSSMPSLRPASSSSSTSLSSWPSSWSSSGKVVEGDELVAIEQQILEHNPILQRQIVQYIDFLEVLDKCVCGTGSLSYSKIDEHPTIDQEGFVDIVPEVIGDDEIKRDSVQNKTSKEVCARDCNSVAAVKDSRERHILLKMDDSMTAELYFKLVDCDFSILVQIDKATDSRNLKYLLEIIVVEEERERDQSTVEILTSNHGEEELSTSVKTLVKHFTTIHKDCAVDQPSTESKNVVVRNNQAADGKEGKVREQNAENLRSNRGEKETLIVEEECRERQEESAEDMSPNSSENELPNSVKSLIKRFSIDPKDEFVQPNTGYDNNTFRDKQTSDDEQKRRIEQAAEDLRSNRREKELHMSIQELINRSTDHEDDTGDETNENGIEKSVYVFDNTVANTFRLLEKACPNELTPAAVDTFSQNFPHYTGIEPPTSVQKCGVQVSNYHENNSGDCVEPLLEQYARIRALCESIAQPIGRSLGERRSVPETNKQPAKHLCETISYEGLKSNRLSQISSTIVDTPHVPNLTPYTSVQELIKFFSNRQIEKQNIEKAYADSCLPQQGCVKILKAKYNSNQREVLDVHSSDDAKAECTKDAGTAIETNSFDKNIMKPFSVESDREFKTFPQTLDSKNFFTIKQRIQQLLESCNMDKHDNSKDESEHKLEIPLKNENISGNTEDVQKPQESISVPCGGYKFEDSCSISLPEFLKGNQQQVSVPQTLPLYPLCLNNIQLQSQDDVRTYSGHHVLEHFSPNCLRRSKCSEDLYRDSSNESNISLGSFEHKKFSPDSGSRTSSSSKENTKVPKQQSASSNSSGFYESIQESEPRSCSWGNCGKSVQDKFVVNLYESRTATLCSSNFLSSANKDGQVIPIEDTLHIKNTDETCVETEINHSLSKKIDTTANRGVNDIYFVQPSTSGISHATKMEEVNFEVEDLKSDSDAVDETLKDIEMDSEYLLPTAIGEKVEKDSDQSYFLLRQQADIQATTIQQATKALELCKKYTNLVVGTEMIEVERALLLATCRYDQTRREIQKIRCDITQHHRVDALGTLVISNLHLPLVAINTKCKQYSQYFIVVLSQNTKVFCTKVVKCDYQKRCVSFEDKFVFDNLAPDFVVIVDIYNFMLKQKGKKDMCKLHFGKKQEGSIPRKRLFYKDVQTLTPIKTLVAQSSFRLCGSANISLENLHKGTWRIKKFCDSMADDFLKISVNLSAVEIRTTKKGFLTLGANVKDRLVWNRRWCVLEGPEVKFFNYPDDEGLVEPKLILNLRHCLTDKVEICDRERCARARTLLLKIGKLIGAGDVKATVKKDPPSDTYLLNADSVKEMLEWREKITLVIRALRQWNKLEFIENRY